MRWLASTILALLGTASPAHGQVDTVWPISTSPNHPTLIAVSDHHSLLVVGRVSGKGQHMAAYRLDDAGEPDRNNVQKIKLPRSNSLEAFHHFALSAVFHPRLPLLYVWQDLAGPRPDKDQKNALYGEFDHLLIYSIEKDAIKLVTAAGRGKRFTFNNHVGRLAIDPGGRRVYMPNLNDPRDGRGALGYFELDDKGMPRPVPVPIEGELDAYGLPKTELKMRPILIGIPRDIRDQPTGWGYVTPPDSQTEDVVLFSTDSGLGVWDTGNRRGAINHVVAAETTGNNLIVGHPKLPVVYGFQNHNDWVYRIEHADGYPTLMPTTVRIAGVRFQSPPVVMTKLNRLAVGVNGAVLTLELTAEGHLADRSTRIRVGHENRPVRAVAWSDKFNCLYAAVEQTK